MEGFIQIVFRKAIVIALKDRNWFNILTRHIGVKKFSLYSCHIMFKFCPHNKSSEFINPSTSCHSNMFITNHGTFWYSFFLLPFLFSSGHISNRSFEDFLQEKSAFKEDRIFRNLGHKILICKQNLFMFQINVLLSMQKKQR